MVDLHVIFDPGFNVGGETAVYLRSPLFADLVKLDEYPLYENI